MRDDRRHRAATIDREVNRNPELRERLSRVIKVESNKCNYQGEEKLLIIKSDKDLLLYLEKVCFSWMAEVVRYNI